MAIEVPVRERKPPRLPVLPEFERYFDRLMRRTPFDVRHAPQMSFGGQFLPDIDVFERNDKIVVRADIPGMKPDDIDVKIDRGMLIISGQREEENEVRDGDYYCSERFVGQFFRTIRLPDWIKVDDVKATYDKGVLEVTIPRAQATESRAFKIPIKLGR
jgi:HSP20 family protein